MDKLIVGPLTESAISTVIVIDALDECKDEEPASAILLVLERLVSGIPRVKFFLTSRPEPWLWEGFRRPLLAEATNMFVLHKVEPSLVGSDIRLFFMHSFSEIRDRLKELDNWPTETDLDTLCERAKGLFVYAVATVKFVGHQKKNPRAQLNHIMRLPESSVYEGETKVKDNATLDSLYMSILQEAFDNPRDDPEVRFVLGAVVLATNPLSPSAIAAILDIDPTSVSTHLSLVHSLLILGDANHPVQPFHKSFPDFIVDPTRCTNLRFHISLPVHHSELLIGCLELMNKRLERDMCKLKGAIMNSEVGDLDKSIYIGHDLCYACQSWHKHLVDQHMAPNHMSKIVSVLHQFLRKKFLFWLEVLSLLGTVREAVDALGATKKWLEVCQVYTISVLPEFTHTRHRNYQPLTLSITAPNLLMTTSDLSLDPLRSSACLLHISITQPSPYLPKHLMCGNYTNNTPIPY